MKEADAEIVLQKWSGGGGEEIPIDLIVPALCGYSI
jgi:hypothetical protein